MSNQEYDRYNKEMEKHLSLMTQNILSQDSVLVQVSGVLLAILATLGKSIILANKTLSYIVIITLGLTIIQVIIGYVLSTRFFRRVMDKLTENYNSQLPLENGLENIFEGKINAMLNMTQFISFALGIIFFIILLVVYIGGLK